MEISKTAPEHEIRTRLNDFSSDLDLVMMCQIFSQNVKYFSR